MISREIKQAMLEMRDAGMTLAAIAERFKISGRAVDQHINRLRARLAEEKSMPDGIGLLSARARQALKNMGITSREQAKRVSAQEFLEQPNLGQVTLKEIESWVRDPLLRTKDEWDGMPAFAAFDGYHYVGAYIVWWGQAWQGWLMEGRKNWLTPMELREKISGPYLGPVPSAPQTYTRGRRWE
jgi:hypothetical protein